MFATRLFQLFCVLFAIGVSFVYYDDVSESSIEGEFSGALRAWMSRGKYMAYKNAHRIFYIAEHLVPAIGAVEPEDHAVLFLHGFPTSSFDFARVWKQFASPESSLRTASQLINVTHLVTFDYLGYGFSDKPLDYDDHYSIFDMADMVDKLLLHLK